MRTAAQLRCLIANDHQRLAWLAVMLDEAPLDALPRNFHAQCVAARQALCAREADLAQLLSPAAPDDHLPSDPAGSLATSGAAQPAISL
ncbi:MAG: hypothetical protein Q8J78_04940 [Moraxellaceae bacterium]|nr:hypothetical protein [Moraxellaceae bacterium]